MNFYLCLSVFIGGLLSLEDPDLRRDDSGKKFKTLRVLCVLRGSKFIDYPIKPDNDEGANGLPRSF